MSKLGEPKKVRPSKVQEEERSLNTELYERV